MVFPVERSRRRTESGEGWGLVGGLEEGREYGFSVAAVVVVGGESRQGKKTQPINVTMVDTSGKEDSEEENQNTASVMLHYSLIMLEIDI